MIITKTKVTQLTITDIQNSPGCGTLDPIRVVIENYEPGKGRITVSCYGAAWAGYWGAMSGQTLEQFFTSCNADYLASNMGSASGLRSGPNYRAYLIRVITAVQHALVQMRPKVTPARAARIERLGHANDLIKVVSDHGRRFFWNESAKRVAHMELDQRGKLWWIDDYRGARVCVEKMGGYEHGWRGFSHGGTLKSLAQAMRDYIKTGARIRHGYIAPEYWGYSLQAAQACRDAALMLPIIYV